VEARITTDFNAALPNIAVGRAAVIEKPGHG